MVRIEIDLTALGADPRHKDLFVEMDYMVHASTAYGLAPSSAVMSAVRIAFENAPISNPDGTNGIRLHALFGNEVPYDANLGVDTAGCGSYDWSEFRESRMLTSIRIVPRSTTT